MITPLRVRSLTDLRCLPPPACFLCMASTHCFSSNCLPFMVCTWPHPAPVNMLDSIPALHAFACYSGCLLHDGCSSRSMREPGCMQACLRFTPVRRTSRQSCSSCRRLQRCHRSCARASWRLPSCSTACCCMMPLPLEPAMPGAGRQACALQQRATMQIIKPSALACTSLNTLRALLVHMLEHCPQSACRIWSPFLLGMCMQWAGRRNSCRPWSAGAAARAACSRCMQAPRTAWSMVSQGMRACGERTFSLAFRVPLLESSLIGPRSLNRCHWPQTPSL